MLADSNWLHEVELTSSMGPLFELWPTAPPEPVYSSSAHVFQCLLGKQSPSDRRDFHSVLVAESLGLQSAGRSCGLHLQQILEKVSLPFLLWLAGWAFLGSPTHTSPRLHEPVEYHYPEVPLCLSSEGFLIETSSGWCGHDWSGELPAAQLSLTSPPLCEKVRQDVWIYSTLTLNAGGTVGVYSIQTTAMNCFIQLILNYRVCIKVLMYLI